MMPTPLPQKRHVQFAVDLFLYHDGAVLDVEDVSEADVWYQMDELRGMKHDALRRSRGKDALSLGSVLSSTYGRYNKDTIDAVHTWVSSCESLRGLERFANSDFGEKRTSARSRTIQVVLTAQHRMLTDGVKDNDHIRMMLGRLSETFSQDYARFAVILGHADMSIVLPQHDTFCVDHTDFADSQKIEPSKILIRDAIVKTPSRNMRSQRALKSPSFHLGSKISPSNTPREFTEMKLCF